MRIEIKTGTSVYEAAREAIEKFSSRPVEDGFFGPSIGEEVRFDFNGVEIVVLPTMSVDQVVGQYWSVRNGQDWKNYVVELKSARTQTTDALIAMTKAIDVYADARARLAAIEKKPVTLEYRNPSNGYYGGNLVPVEGA